MPAQLAHIAASHAVFGTGMSLFAKISGAHLAAASFPRARQHVGRRGQAASLPSQRVFLPLHAGSQGIGVFEIVLTRSLILVSGALCDPATLQARPRGPGLFSALNLSLAQVLFTGPELIYHRINPFHDKRWVRLAAALRCAVP